MTTTPLPAYASNATLYATYTEFIRSTFTDCKEGKQNIDKDLEGNDESNN